MSGGRQAAQRKQPAASEGKKAARRPSAGLAVLLSDEEELNRQPRHWIQCALLDDSVRRVIRHARCFSFVPLMDTLQCSSGSVTATWA